MADDTYVAADANCGINISKMKREKVYVKCSSITGTHARLLIENKNYEDIVQITSGGCTCEGEITCETCEQLEVWRVYANDIYPLLMKDGIPDRLQLAIEKGELPSCLNAIKKECNDWLFQFVVAFGNTVTPYVHIIGKHLHYMLEQPGNSVGAWSQQGFEACHKLIRRIYSSGTSHGGGHGRSSALTQIFQHLYCRALFRIRDAWENNPWAARVAQNRVGYEQENEVMFYNDFYFPLIHRIESGYKAKYPKRTMKLYASTQARKLSRKIEM